MPLTDFFEPLSLTDRNAIAAYHQPKLIDMYAEMFRTDTTCRNLLTPELQKSLIAKDAIVEWLKSLIPNPVNQAGDWRMYFLKNFTRTWITAKYPGPGMDEIASYLDGDIKEKLRMANSGRYRSFQSLTLKKGTGQAQVTEFNAHVKKVWTGVKQIGWRGDDRDPCSILVTGFSPRVSTGAPVWRPDTAERDVDLDTTVCVARDLRGSAFFPLSKPVLATWGYCVIIKEGWNTYYLQKEIAKEKKLSKTDPGYNKTVWMFHEKCVSKVEPTDILLYIKIERQIFDGNDPLSGIRFRAIPDSGRSNAEVFRSLDQEQRTKVLDTLKTYSSWYPAKTNEWLTYDGVVTK